ncbi:MAG: hypothetical protein FWC38_00875 [Proteobacteria bacterium]|nr:hypothetical protein [Pseudomonadota bacterium]MCL2306796.1 hypothetical protein [Pseudomonadota bacterium]
MERNEYMRIKGELVTAQEDARLAEQKLTSLWSDLRSFANSGDSARRLPEAGFGKARQLLDDISLWQAAKQEADARVDQFRNEIKGVQIPPA